ncbi:hypothetical protein ABB26_03690 [Stenotrophomonas humi]|uniref:Arc-like DNA binding domain-containing protein n=1 Tax=Stenotrophomonas humi TaxID=405444 RepID=A0A0R0C8D0_9GAMM|nr:Arc family DNA-binding protein [Stenotrophomonas humi]KRG65653.1 hypothetical protein ABB26_03690 [Stenotrophomonas humi]
MAKKDDQQTNVRLPSELKRKVSAAAEEAGRSFTAEVVLRLEASFQSVLEASLLYARMSDRQMLEDDIRECQEQLDKLRIEFEQYASVPPDDAMKEGATDLLLRGMKSVAEEISVLEDNIQHSKRYLARVNEDISVIADGLQAKLNKIREAKSAAWRLS